MSRFAAKRWGCLLHSIKHVNKNKLRWCRRLDIIIPLPSYNMLFLQSHFLSWEVGVLTGALRFCRNVTPKHVNVAVMAWGPVRSHLANNCSWEKHAFATSWKLTERFWAFDVFFLLARTFTWACSSSFSLKHFVCLLCLGSTFMQKWNDHSLNSACVNYKRHEDAVEKLETSA